MARYWPKFFGLRLRIKERGYYPAILTGKAWLTEDFTLQRKYFALTRIKNIRAKKKKPTVIRAPNKLLRIVYAFSVLTSFYRFLHSNAALSKNYELLKSAKHKMFSCVESKWTIPSGQDGAIWLVRVPNENTGFALLCPLALLTI